MHFSEGMRCREAALSEKQQTPENSAKPLA